MINPPSSHSLVDVNNSRLPDQRAVMEEILSSGLCPFCSENIRTHHQHPFIKETTHWLLTENRWPYEFTKTHLLAISKVHAEHLFELPSDAGADLWALLSWAEQEYQAPGGGFALRFGDTKYSAGTIRHLHAQFIIPDITATGFQPVRFKLGVAKTVSKI